jgi:hypothetical protein
VNLVSDYSFAQDRRRSLSMIATGSDSSVHRVVRFIDVRDEVGILMGTMKIVELSTLDAAGQKLMNCSLCNLLKPEEL